MTIIVGLAVFYVRASYGSVRVWTVFLLCITDRTRWDSVSIILGSDRVQILRKNRMAVSPDFANFRKFLKIFENFQNFKLCSVHQYLSVKQTVSNSTGWECTYHLLLACTGIRTHMNVDTCTYTCIHAYYVTCMHTYMHTHTHTYVHTYIHTYICVCMREQMYVCMHTYIDRYT